MGWFTPKCPHCGGVLQSTGFCAPYPTHRCQICIENHRRDAELKALRSDIAKLKGAV
jgi:tRNA(Ile2) C34 agmatinyltransferase TiaS